MPAPSAPTIGTAVAGDGQAAVAFTPGADGGSPILDYTATATPGGMTATSVAAGPLVVQGLADGTAYTFTVHERNADGTSPESADSNSVTPTPGGDVGHATLTVPSIPTIPELR